MLWAAAAAAVAQAAPLTAVFESVPERHDGSGVIAVELAFSSPMAGLGTYRKVKSALQVTGAELVDVVPLSMGVGDRWQIRVRPTSDAPVTLSLPEGRNCRSAPCTADGGRLARAVSVTVPGP